MTIPLFKVLMTDEAKQNAVTVLGSGHIAQGPKVDQFEAQLTKYLRVPTTRRLVTVNSGTSALDLAMHLVGIGKGDEVITTPMTCAATNIHLAHRGATIVWADVDPVSGLIDPEDVARKITKKTRAVIAVDWQGTLCNYHRLRSAIGKQIKIIEDAAHAFGALTVNGATPAEGQADYICYSFQAIKHLTTGDGGAVIVPKQQADLARRLRWFGLDRTLPDNQRFAQDIAEPGFKYHMNDLAAAIGLGNLPAARQAVLTHRDNAAYYRMRFAQLQTPHFLGCASSLFSPTSAAWIFTILVDEPIPFTQHMARRGITVSSVHKRNDHHSGLKPVKALKAPLVGLDHFAAHQIAIPCGWWVPPEDREVIANAVEDWTTRSW